MVSPFHFQFFQKVNQRAQLNKSLRFFLRIFLLVNVLPVGPDETDKTLWGEGPVDPKSALEASGFQMRRVVLTPRRRR